jgi:hypothetical protein
MPTSVLTQHNNIARTGHNGSEDFLHWANVNVDEFGKLCEHAVNGFVYAQPLFVPGVEVEARGSTDLVIVATMRNMIYAFDAAANASDAASHIWERQLGYLPPVPSNSFGNDYNDMYHSHIGILSTPVVDVEAGTLYVVAMAWDASRFNVDPENSFRHFLFALDLTTGRPRNLGPGTRNPTIFEGRVPGLGYLAQNSAQQARRRGDAVVVDGAIPVDRIVAASTATLDVDLQETRRWPIHDGSLADEQPHVMFNSMQQIQRPGLLLVNGVIYSAFGSHGDADPYHGWVFAHDASTLESKGIFCTTANGSRGGIWQAGEGLVADSHGDIYVATGNGDTNADAGNYGECLVKLRPDADGLRIVSYANVFEDPSGPGNDEDFGASSPTLLPDGLMVGGGKDGNFYLFDPTATDGHPSDLSLKQIFLASHDAKAHIENGATYHIHGSPVVFEARDGVFVYVWGENDYLRCFRYDPALGVFPGQPNERNMPGLPTAIGSVQASADKQFTGSVQASADKQFTGMPGGFLSLSSNGGRRGTGIVWASFPPYANANQNLVRGELRAFKADEFENGRLVSLWSSRCNRDRDDYGIFAKFCCPTIAGGRVFQPTFNEAGSLVVYGMLPQENGGYDYAVCGHSGLALNGSAFVSGGRVHLTEVGFGKDNNRQRNPHASSVFLRTSVSLLSLNVSFIFSVHDYPNFDKDKPRPIRETEGFTFCIQAASPYALGGKGSGFGYGPDIYSRLDRGTRVSPSIGVAFGLTNDVVGLRVDGATPGEQDPKISAGVSLTSGNHIEVTITCSEDELMLSLLDLDADKPTAIIHVFKVGIAHHLGEQGLIGLTAATGDRSYTFVLNALDMLEPRPLNTAQLAARKTNAKTRPKKSAAGASKPPIEERKRGLRKSPG